MATRKVAKLYANSDYQREQFVEDRRSTGREKYRSDFRRDYARLIHSPAFRRLQGKTQVFPGNESDFFRNRLTHSIEVAQIAKAIAYRLNAENSYFRKNNINVDLVEFAGMAHDLGHPPFGHNGEKALDACMIEHGGFEGNAQTLRILARLEKKETETRTALPLGISASGVDCRLGLNLTYRSLGAILKYDSEIPSVRNEGDKVKKGYYKSEAALVDRIKKQVLGNYAGKEKFKTIECSIMDIADDIAYSTYDLEDTFKAGFLTPIDVVTIGDLALLERVAKKASDGTKLNVTSETVIRVLLKVFGDIFTRDWSRSTKANRRMRDVFMAARAYQASRNIAEVGYYRTKLTADLVSDGLAGIQVKLRRDCPILSKVELREETLLQVEVLKHFTYEATIMSPRLRLSERRGFDIVKTIFDSLRAKDGYLLLPEDFRKAFLAFKDASDKQRVICDFIAGMTDRYAVEFYGRIASDSPESIFKPH